MNIPPEPSAPAAESVLNRDEYATVAGGGSSDPYATVAGGSGTVADGGENGDAAEVRCPAFIEGAFFARRQCWRRFPHGAKPRGLAEFLLPANKAFCVKVCQRLRWRRETLSPRRIPPQRQQKSRRKLPPGPVRRVCVALRLTHLRALPHSG